jgi:hypothetical protein
VSVLFFCKVVAMRVASEDPMLLPKNINLLNFSLHTCKLKAEFVGEDEGRVQRPPGAM